MATKKRRKQDVEIHLVRIYPNSQMHAFKTIHPLQDEREPCFDGDARKRFREVTPHLASGAAIEFGNQAIGFTPVTASEQQRLRNGSQVWRDVDAGSVVVG